MPESARFVVPLLIRNKIDNRSRYRGHLRSPCFSQLWLGDRHRLDKIFDYARMHANPGTVVSIPYRIDEVFMFVLVEMHGGTDDLEALLRQQTQ